MTFSEFFESWSSFELHNFFEINFLRSLSLRCLRDGLKISFPAGDSLRCDLVNRSGDLSLDIFRRGDFLYLGDLGLGCLIGGDREGLEIGNRCR